MYVYIYFNYSKFKPYQLIARFEKNIFVYNF